MKHRSLVILFCCASITVVPANSEKWVWGENEGRDAASVTAAGYGTKDHLRREETAQYAKQNRRPFVDVHRRPSQGVLVGPGGPTGIVNRPSGGGSVRPISVPSWVKDDLRYREHDTCLCRYSFNCPSTGLKFGTCSRNKKYCCFDAGKHPELLTERVEGNEYRPTDTNWRNDNN